MKQKILNIIEKGITSNMLKCVAVLSMLIDHIGYYFSPYISHVVYLVFRSVGRISMPVFIYLLVQGFFHTKNLKKYILRLGILAIVTQVILSVIGIINIKFVNQYDIGIYTKGNILFSFVISLILLYIIHNKVIIKKFDYNKNMIVKILIVLCITGIYVFIPIDYSQVVPLLAVFFYFIEKLKISFYLSKQGYNFNLKKILANTINESKVKLIYIILITMTITGILLEFNESPYMLLSVPFIALYNFERGKNRYNINTWFYVFFPLHHTILYALALIVWVYR